MGGKSATTPNEARDEYKIDFETSFKQRDRLACGKNSYNLGLSIYRQAIEDYNQNKELDTVILRMTTAKGYANYAGSFYPKRSEEQTECFKLGSEIEDNIRNVEHTIGSISGGYLLR